MSLRHINKEEIKQKTKAFFRSEKWKNFLVFLVFVGIVSGFWFMQSMQQTRKNTIASLQNVRQEIDVIIVDSLREKGKEVPIRINGSLSPASGYRFIDSLLIDPATVWVYGDKKNLDSLQWIQTVTVKEERIQNNLDLTLKLQVPKGLQTSIQKVRITAGMEEYAEKRFELPIVFLNPPNDIHVRFFPSTAEIICYVSLNHYASLSAEDLQIGVDYNELIQNTGITISPVLLRKPQWLTDYRIIPELVEYLIEQKRVL